MSGPQRRLAAVVLAAGGGARLGRPKALVRVRGRTLVERAAAVAGAVCDDVTVVAGAAAPAVRACLAAADPDVRTVVNEDWRAGMASSLRVGLVAARRHGDGVAILLADQPGIGPDALEHLAARWRDGAEAVTATFGGRQRPPVVLDGGVLDEVTATLAGDRGAGPWLRAHPGRVTAVPCDDLASPADLDTPADLGRWRARSDGPATDPPPARARAPGGA